jgi:polyribonucleotide nucleotidyltransferase
MSTNISVSLTASNFENNRMPKSSEINLSNQKFIVQTGLLAKQASGSIRIQYGDTVVLTTVCAAKKPREGQDFFPLTVEYQEKAYAGGVIPGGFFKREGRSTEKEILTSRLTDRPMRPLFPDGYKNEVQIIASVLSSDATNDPDILCLNGASLALMLSEVPFLGPVAAVRVGVVNGEFKINPTYAERKNSSLDLVVAGTTDGVTMIESEAQEITSDRMIEALEFAHKNIKTLCKFQSDFVKGISKEKILPEQPPKNNDLIKAIENSAIPAFKEINKPKTKEDRQDAIAKLNADLVAEHVKEGSDVTEGQIKEIVHDIEHDEVRKFMLKNKTRVDGRKPDQIRKVDCAVDVLPRTHGSALFTRGQTQSLAVTTLGTSRDEQIIESYEGAMARHFMLHYNFPPFSVGETKMMRGPGRREIGHGALAWRGLKAVIPTKEEFPYIIRVVSDILESNGSSSMASVCAGSLSLMASGVPIKSAVSGIAMGLIQEGDDWIVLSDIAGVEDHLGDMDFKVAGTAKGITTLQLDIKLKEGLKFNILKEALEQANAGRLYILDIMNKTISESRKELSEFAPRLTRIKIHPDKIREIIGPGGKMIRKISQESGASIEVNDEGTVTIASSSQEAAKKAIELIGQITQEPEVGKIYPATVKRLMNFGAFCEFLPGREGLVHVSELSDVFTKNVADIVKVGDRVEVKVMEIDPQGRVNLTMRKSSAPRKDDSNPRKGGRFDNSKSTSDKRARY